MVILDSRGFLHLRSGNPEVKEFTLALSESHGAAWRSDGQRWGSRYFHREHKLSSDFMTATEMCQTVEHFLAELKV